MPNHCDCPLVPGTQIARVNNLHRNVWRMQKRESISSRYHPDRVAIVVTMCDAFWDQGFIWWRSCPHYPAVVVLEREVTVEQIRPCIRKRQTLMLVIPWPYRCTSDFSRKKGVFSCVPMWLHEVSTSLTWHGSCSSMPRRIPAISYTE